MRYKKNKCPVCFGLGESFTFTGSKCVKEACYSCNGRGYITVIQSAKKKKKGSHTSHIKQRLLLDKDRMFLHEW